MPAVVAGSVKDYPWGMVDGMVPWTGRGTGKPQAELWFGVHPAGPSPTLDGTTADRALAGADVPLLVKILAAAHPLSIQIHPDAEQAALGFASQPSGSRTYSDPAAKNEMIVAMTEFQALAGWRPPKAAARILSALGYGAPVQEAAREQRWTEAAALILEATPHGGPWDPGLVRRAIPTDDPREAAALGDIAAAYPDDPCVGVAAVLAYTRLTPGDAMYLPAGVPHAYLRGVGLEVMTSSDNVLRLGLTNKEIAKEEALRAIRDDVAPCVLLDPGPKAPKGAPFRVLLQRGVRATLSGGHYRVVVAIDGPVTVTMRGTTADLVIGQAILIPADEPKATVTSDAMVALVEAVPPGRRER